ncbi:polyketide cyclase [Mycobacterium uberis]|uniref:polyketide cyclase n=1 Tax=Mycobacterium uberis TaxID=2162698 RepID=UPI001FB26D2D|nr:polyketide cyclase [Mycobacterium uberis]
MTSAKRIFDLIINSSAELSWQQCPRQVAPGQRFCYVGDVFLMTLIGGAVRENHVVESIESGKIAWWPAEFGKQLLDYLWRWELKPMNVALTTVTQTFTTGQSLTDKTRLARASATTY